MDFPLWLLSLSVNSAGIWAAEQCRALPTVPRGLRMCGWDRAGALKLHNYSSRMIFLVITKNFLHGDCMGGLGGLLFMVTGWCGLYPPKAAVVHSDARIGVSPGFAFLEIPT